LGPPSVLACIRARNGERKISSALVKAEFHAVKILVREGKLQEYAVLTVPLIILQCLILFVQRTYGLEKYATFGDGLEYINLARVLLNDPVSVIVNLHPPMYPLAIRILGVLFRYEAASLLVNAIAHILSIIPIYESVKLTVASNHKKLAMMASVFPPATLTYAGIGLSDTLAIFLSSIFFYFLLKRDERGMIVAALLASLTHQITYLLIVPLGCFYLRQNLRRLYRTFIPLLPVIILSLYRYLKGQGIGYYVIAHFTFAKVYWESLLFSFPFESLIGALMGRPIRAGGINYPVTLFSVVQVIFLLIIYLGGTILSWKNRDIEALSYSLPFIVFLAFYQVWFFIPRFLTFCFPLLISYGHLMGKRGVVLHLAVALSMASLIYSVYFLLCAFPFT